MYAHSAKEEKEKEGLELKSLGKTNPFFAASWAECKVLLSDVTYRRELENSIHSILKVDSLEINNMAMPDKNALIT